MEARHTMAQIRAQNMRTDAYASGRSDEREQRALQEYWADPMRLVELEAEAGDPLLQD